jgi:signal transduction histidine kinase
VIDLLNRWFADEMFLQAAEGRNWPIEVLWAHLLAEGAMVLAYCAIAAALLYLVRHRRDMRFVWAYILFSAFFLVSAASHVSLILSVWSSNLWVPLLLKSAAAIFSVAAAASLWPIVPIASQMPSRRKLAEVIRRLEQEVVERRNAEEALRDSQAMLRELAAYQERIREDERKRIAREIHDDLGQNLLALRLDVSMLHARTGDRHRNFNDRISTALGHIDTTMKSVRAIINNLRPPVLDLGLHAAIEWQVKEFSRMSNIICELSVDDQDIALGDEQATAVFRVLQESLTNVKRHACATHVDIELRSDDNWLSLEIHDDGVGMYPGDRRKTHRFGLVGMAERIAMLGGELHINSLPGQGTALQLSIPLRQPREEDNGVNTEGKLPTLQEP